MTLLSPPAEDRLEDWVRTTWDEAIQDRPLLNIWEHARDRLVFTAKMSNREGAYDPDLTPFAKLFQEAITNDFRNVPEEDWWLQALLARGQRVDEAFVVKSSQSGFTQAALNSVIYLALHAPGRLLYVLDSVPKAKRVATQRLIPFLKQLCGRVIEDEADLNSTFIELANMIIEFGGSYSAGLFSEKPLRYGFLDDVEYMVAEGGIAGMLDGVHVIDHIRSRFTTADDSFHGVFSKPNLESSEFITNARGGSQHRFYVRCPMCNARQTLEPERLFYDHPGCKDLAGRYDMDAVEALTTYRCVKCEGHIEEQWKHAMNLDGIWLPKSREQRVLDDDPSLAPRRLSMQISDLHSPFPKVKWGKLACMKAESENNPAKLKHLVTNHFARPWREKVISIKAEHVLAIRAGAIDPKTGKHFPDDLDTQDQLKVPKYKRGECPFRPVMISATSDVQGDQYKWGICGWTIEGACALIEYGALLSTQDLYEMMIDPRAHDGSPLIYLGEPDGALVVEHGLIDSGHDTYNIYDFCIRTGWQWYPSKGVGAIDTGGKLVEGREDFYEGQPILRYHYHDSALKTHFYKGKIERAHDMKLKSPRLYLPWDIENRFIIELLSESLIPDPTSANSKRMKWFHDKKVGPNDWGDMMKMQFALWQIVGPALQAEYYAKLAAGGQAAAVRHYTLKAPAAAPVKRPDLAAILAAVTR